MLPSAFEQHPAALVRVKAAALHDAGGVMGCGVVPGGGQGLTHEGGFSNGFPVDGVQGINNTWRFSFVLAGCVSGRV